MMTLEELNAKKEQELMQALYGNPFDQKAPTPEVYRMLLKRKRLGALLHQMLAESDYGELAKMTKFTRGHLSEEDI